MVDEILEMMEINEDKVIRVSMENKENVEFCLADDKSWNRLEAHMAKMAKKDRYKKYKAYFDIDDENALGILRSIDDNCEIGKC